jgi:hypothetical protein
MIEAEVAARKQRRVSLRLTMMQSSLGFPLPAPPNSAAAAIPADGPFGFTP